MSFPAYRRGKTARRKPERCRRIAYEMLEDRRVFYAVNTPGVGYDADPNDGVCDSDLNAPGQQITWAAATQCINRGDGPANITFDNVNGAIDFSSGGLDVPTTIDGGNSLLTFVGTMSVGDSSTVTNLIGANVALGSGNTVQNSSLTGLTVTGDGNQIINNTISGGVGVTIGGSNNELRNNRIGTNSEGTSANQNITDGIDISGASNVIADNVISGNKQFGIYIFGSNAHDNHIENNKIGVAADGVTPLGNLYSGIQIENAGHNIIGGDGKGNIIAGNREDGIRIRRGTFGSTPSNSFDNQIVGNFIGLGGDGNTTVPNRLVGIRIYSLVAKDPAGGTSWSVEIRDNVISGNGDTSGGGIEIGGSDVLVTGNKIGTNAAGTAKVPNKGAGVRVTRALNADGNNIRIGGANPTMDGVADFSVGNLISGNTSYGFTVDTSATFEPVHDITVQGNRIGTNLAGTAALGNDLSGISVTGANIQIGGGGEGEGNLVSGNNSSGIVATISSTSTTFGSVYVQGNIVGLNLAGDAALPNSGTGIFAAQSANYKVGGMYVGQSTDNAAEGNLVAGNTGDGIYISGSFVHSFVMGNIVGTNRSNAKNLGNQNGIVVNYAHVSIGGDQKQNVVSGNRGDGIRVIGGSVIILGNFVGVGSNRSALGNDGSGIVAQDSEFLSIGSKVTHVPNTIANNGLYGILVKGDQTVNPIIIDNYIGYISPFNAPGNGGGGIKFSEGINKGTIEDNVIAGHTHGAEGSDAFGIGIFGTAAAPNKNISVDGNTLGINDSTAASPLPNTVNILLQYVEDSTVGIDKFNRIAAATVANVEILNSKNVALVQNFIGIGPNHQTISSAGYGIHVTDSENITIGGDTATANYISGNNTGVLVDGNSKFIEIEQNVITGNVGRGIDLAGAYEKNSALVVFQQPAISGTHLSLNGSIVGKPNTSYTLSFYGNTSRDDSGTGEGEEYFEQYDITTDEHGTKGFHFETNNLPEDYPVVSATIAESSTFALSTYRFANNVDPNALTSAVQAAFDFLGNVPHMVATFFHLTTQSQALQSASAGYSSDLMTSDMPVPSGKMLVYDNGVLLGNAAIDAQGRAEFTGTALAAGAHNFVAVYEGDEIFTGVISQVFSQGSTSTPLGVRAGQGGKTPDDEGRGVVVDALGNSYVVGTRYFAEGAADTVTTTASDIFLAKYSKTGQLVWQKVIGGAGDQRGLAIARDSSDNIYITGGFQRTVNFNPGGTAKNLSSAGGFDVFVASYTKNGTFRWAHNYGNAGSAAGAADIGYGIAVDAAKNVIVTGQFAGTVDFDPSAKNQILTSEGSTDAFVLRLTTAGVTNLAKQFGGKGADRGTGVAVDAAKQIYVVGSFTGIADFNPSAAVTNLTSAGKKDAFLARLTSAGALSYARAFGGKSNDEALGVVVDPSKNAYLTGYFAGTADLNPAAAVANFKSAGSNDAFVVRLNSAGNYVWGKAIGGKGDDRGRGITRTSTGTLALVGDFAGTVDFDPSAAKHKLTSHGAVDAFFLSLSAAGAYKSAKAIGGSGTDRGRAVAADNADKLYTTGEFAASLRVATGEGQVHLTSAGGEDLFLIRFK